MALTKSYEVPQGVVGEYHRIQKVEIIPGENRVDILFAVYVNATAKETAKQPLYYKSITIPLDDFQQDPRTVFYRAAKAHVDSYLSGATDSSPELESVNPANSIVIKQEYTIQE